MSLFKLWNRYYSLSGSKVKEILFNFYYHRDLYAFIVTILPMQLEVEESWTNLAQGMDIRKNSMLQQELPARIQEEIRFILEKVQSNDLSSVDLIAQICQRLCPTRVRHLDLKQQSNKAAVILLLKPVQKASGYWKVGILFT